MEEVIVHDRGLLHVSISSLLDRRLLIKINRSAELKLPSHLWDVIWNTKVVVQIHTGSQTVFTTQSKTRLHHARGSGHEYNGSFALDLSRHDLRRKRLSFSVCSTSNIYEQRELLIGCFSLSFCSLFELSVSSPKDCRSFSGWYILLPAERGRTESMRLESPNGKFQENLPHFNYTQYQEASSDGDYEKSTESVEYSAWDQGENNLNEAFCCSSSTPDKFTSRPLLTQLNITMPNHGKFPATAFATTHCQVPVSERGHSEITCSTEGRLLNDSAFQETPSRFNTTMAMNSRYRQVDISSLQLMKRQLLFENADWESKPLSGADPNNSGRVLATGILMNNKKSDKGDTASDVSVKVGCCNAKRVISTVKEQFRKIKNAKICSSNKCLSPRSASATLNKAHDDDKWSLAPDVKYDDPMRGAFPNDLVDSTVQWDDIRSATRFRLVDGSYRERLHDRLRYPSDKGPFECQERYGNCKVRPTHQTDLNGKVALLAVRRWVIGFHKDDSSTALGFSITDNVLTPGEMSISSSGCRHCDGEKDNIICSVSDYEDSDHVKAECRKESVPHRITDKAYGVYQQKTDRDPKQKMGPWTCDFKQEWDLWATTLTGAYRDASDKRVPNTEDFDNTSMNQRSVLSRSPFCRFLCKKSICEAGNSSITSVSNRVCYGSSNDDHISIGSSSTLCSRCPYHDLVNSETDSSTMNDQTFTTSTLSSFASDFDHSLNTFNGPAKDAHPIQQCGKNQLPIAKDRILGNQTFSIHRPCMTVHDTDCHAIDVRLGCESYSWTPTYNTTYTISKGTHDLDGVVSNTEQSLRHCPSRLRSSNAQYSQSYSDSNICNSCGSVSAFRGSSLGSLSNSSAITSISDMNPPSVYVSHVVPGSAADDWGLIPGDVIIAVNHGGIRNMTSDRVARMLREARNNIMLEMKRKTVVWVDKDAENVVA